VLFSGSAENSTYKPRVADDRVGYFLTGYRDLGLYGTETNSTRYINRWNLEKRDRGLPAGRSHRRPHGEGS